MWPRARWPTHLGRRTADQYSLPEGVFLSPPPHRSPSLRVSREPPGRSRALLAGLAGQRWRRRGAGIPVHSSARYSTMFRLHAGFRPCAGCRRHAGRMAAGPSGRIWRWLAVLALMAVLLRSESEAMASKVAGDSVNKAWFCGVLDSGHPVRLRRRGGGRRDGVLGFGAPGEDLAAICGVSQRRRSCAAVIQGRCGHSALCCEHSSFFNLQAGVPTRRPFSSPSAASIVASSPSGVVPGDAADGRSVELILVFGGAGLDCFFLSSVRVLVVKAEGLFVFSLFPKDRYVNCYSTV
jgi:hypothetical protein